MKKEPLVFFLIALKNGKLIVAEGSETDGKTFYTQFEKEIKSLHFVSTARQVPRLIRRLREEEMRRETFQIFHKFRYTLGLPFIENLKPEDLELKLSSD